jgi:hypothetical protein
MLIVAAPGEKVCQGEKLLAYFFQSAAKKNDSRTLFF